MEIRRHAVNFLSHLVYYSLFKCVKDINNIDFWIFCREPGQSKTAFVTFKDPNALEIALLLSVISWAFYFGLFLIVLHFYNSTNKFSTIWFSENLVIFVFVKAECINKNNISPTNSATHAILTHWIRSNMADNNKLSRKTL